MKRSEILLMLAAVPLCAQSGFEHGHKIGSGIAYLSEAGSEAPGAQEAEILANLRIQFADVTGNSKNPGVPTIVNPDARNVAIVVNTRPCAAFETWVEQASPEFAEGAQTGIARVERTEGKAIVHRLVSVTDGAPPIHVSYTVTVETLPDGTYRVTLGPSTDPPPAQGAALSPARFPVPQIMKDEDSIRLELYSNGTSRRVIEYIHAGKQDRMIMRTETPHESYAEDAEIVVAQPRLRVNGIALPMAAGATTPPTARGQALWLYVPGHGRYILALQRHADLGFVSAGEVAGNSLVFTGPDGNVFRIDTSERIAPGSGSYALHILPDLSWVPPEAQNRANVAVGVVTDLAGKPDTTTRR